MVLSPELVGPYSLQRPLGKGTYGCVYEARDTRSGEAVAVKRINYSLKYENIFLFFREISILKSLRHFAVIELRDVVVPKQSKKASSSSTDSIYLVMDLFDSDLRTYVRTRFPTRVVPVESLRFINFQVGTALAYLHAQGVMHRDLKPQNVLIDHKSGRLKLADFGLAKFKRLPTNSACMQVALTHEIVTLWYRAPEVILGASHYDESIDMWSFGAMLTELYSGQNPFNGRSEVETLMKIFQLCGTPNFFEANTYPNFSSQFPKWMENAENWQSRFPSAPSFLHALSHDLLRTEPAKRLTALELMSHPWFAGLDSNWGGAHSLVSSEGS